jgi:predicted GH43/DUF377 family glycosyl hydrolase
MIRSKTNMNIIKRHPSNPIIEAGKESFRSAAVFNPGVIFENNKYYLYERSAQSIAPFTCNITLLESDNGVDFKVVGDKPIITPESIGHKEGTVEDPRVVKIGDDYLMTYAYRPYTYNCYPTGVGLPNYEPLVGILDEGINNTLTAIAKSKDMINFEIVSTLGGDEDERDCILFPEKINGQYAMLRRPKIKNKAYKNIKEPSIWISYSDDLKAWTDPVLVAKPVFDWECGKIGGGATPLKTEQGWVIIYHAVNEKNEYRVGVMLTDLNDPTKVIARGKTPLLEPEALYEKEGVVIPNVVFPTGNVIVDDEVKIYYGVCDTSIALATIKLEDLFDFLDQHKD